ncbi:MAG: ATP-binding protein [Gemmataceae bacterium]|nr:ATP-binding protein [Gemmataceae bacterium]
MSNVFRSALPYGLAVASVALAVALTTLLPLQGTPFALLFAAVLVSAWLGGLGPGLLAIAASGLLALFLPHVAPVSELPSWEVGLRVGIFLTVALLVVCVTLSLQRTEEALRAREEHLRLALEAGGMGTWEWDVPSNRVAWSPALEVIHGLTPGTFAGNFDAVLEDVHPEDRDYFRTTVTRTLQEGLDHRIEYRLLRSGGEVRWVEGRGKLFRDAQGRPRRMVGVCLDVTERKRAEQELKTTASENARLYCEVRDADRRKDEFLATLAHELRNPLAPIRTALHILQEPGITPEQAEEMRAIMERQVQHLARLVDDLLDVSRVMRGKIELRKEKVELQAIVARAVETVRPAIDAQGHRLEVTLPQGKVVLEVDPVRVAQVVANLLNNAARYTDGPGLIQLGAEQQGGDVVLRVRDTGIGISQELLPRVFDLFVQAEHTLARSRGGLGIGLTLVRSLVQLHGGAVEAHSPGLGQGSEFVVRLPAPPTSPEGRSAASGPTPGADGPRRRVLVVDDNLDAAESLALLVRLWGHEVRVAHDGQGALSEATAFRPEVVLLDIGLPGLSGYEVAARLRALPDARATLLVAMTGWGQPQDRQRAREAGFDVHLTKPADPEVLHALLVGLHISDGSRPEECPA